MLLQGRVVRHAARHLPSALSVCGLRVHDGLLPGWLPLRRAGSGALVLQLAQATVRALRTRPAELLGNALRPRSAVQPAYRPWQVLRSARHGLLWLSAQQRERPAWLVVAPDPGVAVYLWRGAGLACGKLAP